MQTLTERLFALRAISPFDKLQVSELAAIAEVLTERRFGANEAIVGGDEVLQRLYFVFEGTVVTADGREMPSFFGLSSLLFEKPPGVDLLAGPQGAVCLVLTKAHFYTAAFECSGLLVHLLEDPTVFQVDIQ
jgi:signal-transduction protein with cAMP-binding, CBS, and nucleotidyltransferase domain